MTKEDIVITDEKEPVVEEAPPEQPLETKAGDQDAVAPKAPEEVVKAPIAVGYVVGVREDGEFVFEVQGTKPGLVELLGVHTYAGRKVDLLYDRAQVEGQAATAMQFQQLTQRVNSIIGSLKEVLNTLVVSNASKKEE